MFGNKLRARALKQLNLFFNNFCLKESNNSFLKNDKEKYRLTVKKCPFLKKIFFGNMVSQEYSYEVNPELAENIEQKFKTSDAKEGRIVFRDRMKMFRYKEYLTYNKKNNPEYAFKMTYRFNFFPRMIFYMTYPFRALLWLLSLPYNLIKKSERKY